MNTQNSHKYDDIIHLPHHVSKNHPQMPPMNRAAQFMPFAALTGHEAAIQETARLTDSFAELDEDRKAQLNQQLLMIREHLARFPIFSRMRKRQAEPMPLSGAESKT